MDLRTPKSQNRHTRIGRDGDMRSKKTATDCTNVKIDMSTNRQKHHHHTFHSNSDESNKKTKKNIDDDNYYDDFDDY